MTDSKKLEIAWETLNSAKNVLKLLYSKTYTDWDDKAMEKYHDAINEMCVEIADREGMDWQNGGYE